jgi:hypothetical protein
MKTKTYPKDIRACLVTYVLTSGESWTTILNLDIDDNIEKQIRRQLNKEIANFSWREV